MKPIFFTIALLAALSCTAQDMDKIVLPEARKVGGKTVMEAFACRASARGFDTLKLELQEVSDLLWAANGINRSAEGKRTAPSAINAQDVDIYLVNSEGAYLYDAKEHSLVPVSAGDYRHIVAGTQQSFARAPLFLVIVSDIARFQRGDEATKLTWAAMDAAIVSENINIFCAGVGLKTRPRVYMDTEKLREVLRLKPTQFPMMNNPVGK